ncbi:capsule biosynthesis protein CapA [Caulobacter segnis]|uniref:Capsule synthesis protein, CapA n=2 Tax=Caulobacter segnis TaxID=88688 RepID=D5VJM9_CAUST|nr:CapA family protein [Caulobacter segnis]ADG10558.1 Capsule synthesis protein, CapA [Caulobacter segnis ATCC 21756]AVQ02275.1 capsule biosynthesis protein CapA [Caulobacter segnis]
MNRRTLLAAGAGLLAVPAIAKPRPLRVALLGQSLIEHVVADEAWPGRRALQARLQRNDVCFTNLETVIRGARAGAPTRESLTVHAGEPGVLRVLDEIGVNLVATSNNHAFDLGSGGILDTVEALERQGLAFAGSGADLTAAAAPSYLKSPVGAVALVAFATGKVRDGGAATASRPGVNELRRGPSGEPVAEDLARILAAIAEARRTAEVVIAYQHNHDWEPAMEDVPGWQRDLARRCVDVGAAAFVGHGAPVLQGAEIYRGAPLLYGLGNFIFQTEKPPGAYPQSAWESVFAECVFERGRLVSLRFEPIVLNEIGRGGPKDMETRGFPRLARTAERKAILDSFMARSAKFGGSLRFGPSAVFDTGAEKVLAGAHLGIV